MSPRVVKIDGEKWQGKRRTKGSAGGWRGGRGRPGETPVGRDRARASRLLPRVPAGPSASPDAGEKHVESKPAASGGSDSVSFLTHSSSWCPQRVYLRVQFASAGSAGSLSRRSAWRMEGSSLSPERGLIKLPARGARWDTVGHGAASRPLAPAPVRCSGENGDTSQ